MKKTIKTILKIFLFWKIIIILIVIGIFVLVFSAPPEYFDEPIRINPDEWNPGGWYM